MQQLQTTVLNQIQPGVTPIFIISPNKSDGDALAFLLSNHLERKINFIDPEDTRSNKNYFSSEDLNTILPNNADFQESKIEDYVASLKYAIDKGFDSNKLWGLQIDYKSFFDLQIAALYPDSFFIFLYGTKMKKSIPIVHDGKKNIPKQPFIKRKMISDESYLQKVYEFYENNTHCSLLLHVNNVLSTPELTLQNLPVDGNMAVIKKREEIVERATSKIHSELLVSENDANGQILKDLNKSNLLSLKKVYFDGNEILVVLILGEYSNNQIILKKIQQFSGSFLSLPRINIICKNELEKYFVQQLLDNNRLYSDFITITACHTNVSTSLNKIISDSSCVYFIIDDLNITYSAANVMLPFKSQTPPAFIYGNSTGRRNNDNIAAKLFLVDILTISSAPDNITFSKNTWAQIKGFDTTLENKIALWDFAIRALETPGAYALETEAKLTIAENEYRDIEKTMIPYEGYKTIIEKHKPLFEASLNEIVKIFSENQFLPQHEILKLNNKVNSINSLLSHSNHELRSLVETRAQLQSHISVLENRWYFKLARKLSHYKNIFFKAKTSRKNGVIQFIKFLFFAFTKPGARIVRKIFKGGIRKLYLLVEDRPVRIVYLDNSENGTILNYNDWIRHKLDINTLRKDYKNTIGTLKVQPKISVIVPVYNPPIDFLNEAIMSVINQLYENWELCIADDCSPNPQIKRILNSYSLKDPRIKVVFRTENGHISESSNSALALATGDYVMLLDHDDVLTPNAMFEVVKHINEHPDDKLIYSDEDKVDGNNNYLDPFFKPDWSPDRFLCINYVSHLLTVEKKLMDIVGGFRKGYEGSQDYDILLRLTELTNKIGHISKILYHWRIHSASVASAEVNAKPYAYIAAKKALEDALVRRNTPGEVHYIELRGSYRIKYDVLSYDKVSIIIPTKDHVQLMKNTVDSIFSLTSYPNYEVIVLNNNSTSKEFFELMNEYQEQYPDKFRCIDANFPFNFSRLINLGVSVCTGEYVLMLNNDVEIIQSDWVTNMVSYCQHKWIGAVGVKLLYPNDHIQHAGTVIGLGAVAGHVLVGVHKNNPGYFNCLQTTTDYSAVTAACLMCRKEVYEEVGGMEEFLEIEYNDVDFCLKIVERGYMVAYTPDVTLYHYESTTRGHPSQNKASYERHLREVAYFKEKWIKYVLNDPFYNPNLSLLTQDFRVDLTK